MTAVRCLFLCTRRVSRPLAAMAAVGMITLTVYCCTTGHKVHRKSTSDDVARTSQILHANVVDGGASVYAARRRRLQQVCEGNNGTGRTENILVYRNMSYGVVPKAGCTFWIRVFRFLHNDTRGRSLDNPFQMTRYEAHGGPRKIKMYRLQKEEDRRVVMATTRFMVARSPFTRLFSAYIDKLYLPDYWSSAGKTIVSRRENASSRSLSCGHDVSFTEFLGHVVDVGERNVVSLNGHWRPIEHACNPCAFKPDIVATQETFSRDSRFILERFGLGHLLQNHSRIDHVLDELTILTDWNYRPHDMCLTRKQLAGRLWRTFQINGYLTPGSEELLEAESSENLTKDKLKQLMFRSYQDSISTKQESSAQRRSYLRQAYASVPRGILDRVVKLFRNDFLYFDYDSSVDTLLQM
ncbi:carbohydrate sulfotransferase 11-like isoform X1 [Haliotis cracherodii]|uniref:carbohydrate sulfotransferase 11-like isoform X1 n=2 Tax=Haliotis cracherodii TaxID=6455 RepID=UPI0039E795EB